MTSTLPKILGISGSLRAGSYSTAILRGLADHLAGKATLTLLTLQDVPLYNGDLDTETPPAGVVALRAAITAADGIILSTPEYNYGASGVMKNAIDWASRPGMKSSLRGKPALIFSSSPGGAGGARAHYQVRESLSGALARVVARPQVTIAAVHEKVKDGKLVDEASIKFSVAAVDDLLREIRATAFLASEG